MNKGLLLLFSALVISGCSSHQNNGASSGIIIDTKGVDMYQYREDVDECSSYAEQVPVAGKAAKTAAGGAVLGGVVGAIIGDSSAVKKGAGVGAVTGAVKGTSSGYRERDRVVKNCLRGRGYRVLN
ncbi:MAG: glycine zipper family protein [Porticoccus sp.]|nr:glycine zipper family protein [Porticoccus sp.]